MNRKFSTLTSYNIKMLLMDQYSLSISNNICRMFKYYYYSTIFFRMSIFTFDRLLKE